MTLRGLYPHALSPSTRPPSLRRRRHCIRARTPGRGERDRGPRHRSSARTHPSSGSSSTSRVPTASSTATTCAATGTKGCVVYADDPHVTFKDDRVVVSVKTHAKLGIGKSCFGISVSTTSEVSFIPEAEGEVVGFRDARIDHLSDNKELNLLLEPFLSKKLPQEMKINAADLTPHPAGQSTRLHRLHPHPHPPQAPLHAGGWR